jgi:hypothetical protein
MNTGACVGCTRLVALAYLEARRGVSRKIDVPEGATYFEPPLGSSDLRMRHSGFGIAVRAQKVRCEVVGVYVAAWCCYKGV